MKYEIHTFSFSLYYLCWGTITSLHCYHKNGNNVNHGQQFLEAITSHFFTHSVSNSVTSSSTISIISGLLHSSEQSQHNISTLSIKYKYILNKISVNFQYNTSIFLLQYHYILNTIPVHFQSNTSTFLVQFHYHGQVCFRTIK